MSFTIQHGLDPFSDSIPGLATMHLFRPKPKNQSRKGLENLHQITDPERNMMACIKLFKLSRNIVETLS